MMGIDPLTGLTVTDAEQAVQRIKKAISTQIGSVEKRRRVGGEYRKQYGLASEQDRMIAINRIHRVIANPDNHLKDIINPVVIAKLSDEGINLKIEYTFNGSPKSTQL